VYDDRTPKRYDSNYLLLETIAAGTTAEELVADAASHDRSMIFVRDTAAAEPLVQGFEALGWRIDRHLIMVQRGPVTRSGPVEAVQELDADALRAPRRRLIAHYPWATPEVLEHLHRAKTLIAGRVETRFLGIVVDGEVVAYGDLYLEPPNAQIEDLGTLEEHRGRGYASAIVLHAAQEARRGGADFVFLVADAHDWPQHLYQRLGFEPVGHYLKFIGPRA
jgi:ribosomal protein S18 acetylase RimI-like enzyme